MEEEADNVRDVINTKECDIQRKEEEINRIKRVIEMETSEKEVEIRRMRQEIED